MPADTPTVDDLLAKADERVAADPWLYECSCDEFIAELAAVLRAQIAALRDANDKDAIQIERLRDAADQIEWLTTLLGKRRAQQHEVDRLTGELGNALDRLDENEGTIAALRHQLADARETFLSGEGSSDAD